MKTTTTTFSAILFLLSVTVSILSATADGASSVAPATKPAIPYKVKDKETPKPIAVQGLIYCKSGSKLIPLKGATARVTCLAKNHNGLELAPFSVSSCPADDKGYFLAKLSPPSTTYIKKAEWELKDCKVFLEKSPMELCKVPLDINGGIKGAHIISTSSYRLLKNANLYSIEPFFYASDELKPVSDKKGY
ncbi:protein SEED AND ROOT HAIR PROTECTIVE PROTEIN-like [Rutidosis leptorrhynchoides]|uniref:protein SEED AND ROOT HAIR PROTECTIVE PROTEIN-like n=1 Tax=Rutidosis leptorrhynchoides TaxID=125765 RepID=UPI003A98E8A2